uniref:Methyltransferase n=1 Tax=uncultured bacterium contig00038 TaxID=1181526 RepID=A0A806K128_9BACT|nr:methyltransferase DNA modification enzyme [uncultured bacterium contig00038]
MELSNDFNKRKRKLAALTGDDGSWDSLKCGGQHFPVITKEFWTSRQRQASSLHEISYRACYKPQLPRFFIERFSSPDDLIYDPFGGRGTTAIEAALHGRRVISNDINPLSAMLAQPRLTIPTIDAIHNRLLQIPLSTGEQNDLDMFFHPQTESEIRAMRRWFLERQTAGDFDHLDAWIRMVATNRLTGHSPGFFSVYTLPPNQAVSRENQKRLNRVRSQTPEYRDTRALIEKKSRQLLKGIGFDEASNLRKASETALFLTCDARRTFEIQSTSVTLTITSPPFLDVVQYQKDNWLRCWFCGLDAVEIGKSVTMAKTLEAWSLIMADVLRELYRITKSGGHIAFEIGEVKRGSLKLEETILPLGLKNGFDALGILINRQSFTKTANIWGVNNNTKGTNSNRIVLFKKL